MPATAAPPSLRPPLKWAGGKRWQVPHLRPLWEAHRRSRLVEPFCGGLAVTLAIYATASVSGTHANPAVTAALWLFRGFPGKRVLPYCVAQVLGGALGAAVVYLLYSPVINDYNASHGMVPLIFAVGAAAMGFTALSYATMSRAFPLAGSVHAMRLDSRRGGRAAYGRTARVRCSVRCARAVRRYSKASAHNRPSDVGVTPRARFSAPISNAMRHCSLRTP